MPSMQDTKTDPHGVLEIAPDVVLVARAAAEFPSLAPDSAHRSSERAPNTETGFAAPPKVDTSFRATDTSGGRARGGWVRKVLLTFLFTSCSALAVAAWEHYGDDAQEMVAGITPQIVPVLRSWLPAQKPATATQPDVTETASLRQTIPPSPALAAAQPPADGPAPTAAQSVTSETTEQVRLLQSMARDIASLTQQVDDLKASVAQLKAAQERQEQRPQQHPEQVSRERPRPEARLSEAKPAEPRPTKLGTPPRPLGTVVQRTRPVYPAPQAGYAPAPLPPPGVAPVQIAPPPSSGSQPDDETVVRPPMPVR